jgi:hypothetical protein
MVFGLLFFKFHKSRDRNSKGICQTDCITLGLPDICEVRSSSQSLAFYFQQEHKTPTRFVQTKLRAQKRGDDGNGSMSPSRYIL